MVITSITLVSTQAYVPGSAAPDRRASFAGPVSPIPPLAAMTRNVSVARTFVQWSGDCGNLFKRNSGLSRFKSVLEDSEEGRNWSHFKSNRWNKGQIGNPRHVGIVRKGRYDTRGGRDCEDFAGRPSIERYKGLSSDNGQAYLDDCVRARLEASTPRANLSVGKRRAGL